MGRKGMKAFMKAVKTGPEEEPNEANEKHDNKAKDLKSTSAGATPAAQPETQHKFDQDVSIPGKETKGQMIQRHKREAVAHKKQISRLGKKNKEEADALTKQLEDRHVAELQELDAAMQVVQATVSTTTATPAPEPEDGPSKYLVSTPEPSVEPVQSSKRVSKAQKRREKHAQKEVERETRIAEGNAAMGPSKKQQEAKRLTAKLRPLGMKVHEVVADGHCLYRALEHQLQQHAALDEARSYLELRKLAAQYIRAHSDIFLPFILAEGESEESDDPEELLESYCKQIENTAEWGGQLEIRALAGALQRHITVYVADLDNVEMGEEFNAQGVLHLCYLRHAFALGEHFNSLEPLEPEDELSSDGERDEKQDENQNGDGAGEDHDGDQDVNSNEDDENRATAG